MTPARTQESDLYGPIKAFLEAQGYDVKGEVGSVDLVAVRGDEDPVLVELKSGFTLTLFHQAIDRQTISDATYIAVPRLQGRTFFTSLRKNRKLCRRLGIGLITVKLETGLVEVHHDPGPYRPRQFKHRQGRLLREFARRVGDPNTGGSPRRTLMTAYRQDALRCLTVLLENGPMKAAYVSRQTGVQRARNLMAADHYGWFERVTTGIYAATPKGESAAQDYASEIEKLKRMQADHGDPDD